jgi:cellulose synthase/poly-beta-1,6-N-acetylglucosamine synthase-like glycosyltransferase
VVLFVPAALSLFFWSLYNLAIFTVGVRHFFGDSDDEEESKPARSVPFISLIVPAKDEEKVIQRLLDSILNVDYPRERMEILIVEDGSSDRTGETCLSLPR